MACPFHASFTVTESACACLPEQGCSLAQHPTSLFILPALIVPQVVECILHNVWFSRRKVTAAAAAAKPLQSCPTLCDPIDGSPPGSPIPGILQARTLEWVAMPFSGDLLDPGIKPISYISCIGRWVLYHYCHLGSLRDGTYMDNSKWLWTE